MPDLGDSAPPCPSDSTAPPGTAGSQTTSCQKKKCCGCVTSVAIENVRESVDGSIQTAMYSGTAFRWANGHEFDLRIELSYTAGTDGVSDCKLEWFESTNHPPAFYLDKTTNKYIDVASSGNPNSMLFTPWKNRKIPCPKGGNVTVVLHDVPSLGGAPGMTMSRKLGFKLVVSSGAGCACAATSAQVTALQKLRMVNGKITSASFDVGAQMKMLP